MGITVADRKIMPPFWFLVAVIVSSLIDSKLSKILSAVRRVGVSLDHVVQQ